MLKKIITVSTFFLISSTSFAKITDSLAQNQPFDYCATQFPIPACSSDDCSANASIMTQSYLSCSNSYQALEKAQLKAPIGLQSFESSTRTDRANPSYLIFSYRYQSLLLMPIYKEVSYEDMKKSQTLVDNTYDDFKTNNQILKDAFKKFSPMDTETKKLTYQNHVVAQKKLELNTNQYRNAVNFMLFSPEFYQQFLTTYRNLYPHNIYNGSLQHKNLSLYECQFINIMDDFHKLQATFQFTCDNK